MFRQAVTRLVLHLIHNTALVPDLGTSLHFQLFHVQSISAKDVFLSCPLSCISLLCASYALALLCSVRCWLLVLTSQPIPIPALLHPSDLRHVLWICWEPTSISALLNSNRHLPVFCYAPPLYARGPPETSAKHLQPPQTPL